MNKMTTNGLSINGLIGLMIAVFFGMQMISAQETYTTIRKNVNPLAFDLNHNLSETQDSLLLENKFLFKRVRFISNTAEKVFNFKPAVKTAKIPLNELPLGKYTVMFYQADKIIVFQINRILPFDLFDGIESDVALNDNSDIESKHGEDVDDYIKPYNLSDLDRDFVQTRADYRRNHLRPNGKPYNN